MEKDAISYHFSKLFSELENRIATRVLEELTNNSNMLLGTPTNNVKLLKDIELCDLLQISISHLYKIKKNNKSFPIVNVGGAIRYKLSEVELFFKELETLKIKKDGTKIK